MQDKHQAAYGESGYGMYLNVPETNSFAQAYAKARKTAKGKVDRYKLNASDLRGSHVYAVRGIQHLDGKPHKEDKEEFCEGVFFYADRQGSIFADKALCYQSIAEMADEFRHKFAAYLPQDFSFEAHMAHFAGSVVC